MTTTPYFCGVSLSFLFSLRPVAQKNATSKSVSVSGRAICRQSGNPSSLMLRVTESQGRSILFGRIFRVTAVVFGSDAVFVQRAGDANRPNIQVDVEDRVVLASVVLGVPA